MTARPVGPRGVPGRGSSVVSGAGGRTGAADAPPRRPPRGTGPSPSRWGRGPWPASPAPRSSKPRSGPVGRALWVVAMLPVCVTGDVPAARERAARLSGTMAALPSYAAMIERGQGPALIAGDEDVVGETIAGLETAGVTDIVAVRMAKRESDDHLRTEAYLRASSREPERLRIRSRRSRRSTHRHQRRRSGRPTVRQWLARPTRTPTGAGRCRRVPPGTRPGPRTLAWDGGLRSGSRMCGTGIRRRATVTSGQARPTG